MELEQAKWGLKATFLQVFDDLKVVDKFDQKTDVLWSSKKGGNVKSTIKTRSKEGTLLDTQELDKHLKDTRGKKSK